MKLLDFLDTPEMQGRFPSKLSPRGGYITFRNSGQRGSYKYFQLGLDSILLTLKDIKKNITKFNSDYVEKDWRDSGAEYFTDQAANAMSTVQTKPLFSTLSKIIVWANLPNYSSTNTEEHIILVESALNNAINKLESLTESYKPKEEVSNNPSERKNIIYFGPPGTGKSRKVKERTQNTNEIKTVFHPDTDYAAFVGVYKPSLDENRKITYSFVPQSFTKAYIKAWKNPSENTFLVIEEINRGNCAQIFGDIFQLLDRRHDGYSEYTIDIDTDFADYLKATLDTDDHQYLNKIKEISNTNDADFSKILLPPNLFILATMNTSDQSLFPMDSAFKRRWDWVFIPINMQDASSIIIDINGTKYNWGDFLRIINPKIKSISLSEDKQMGNRFINPPNNIITFDQFRSKVLFYLWFEIYKDETETPDTIFKISEENEISFTDFFSEEEEENIKKLNQFLNYNGLEILSQNTNNIENTSEKDLFS